jgi:hypothetical protein
MKTKIVTALLCTVLVSSSTGGEAWSAIRSIPQTNLDSWSQESEAGEKQIIQGGAAVINLTVMVWSNGLLAISGGKSLPAIAGLATLREWLKTPLPTMSNLKH